MRARLHDQATLHHRTGGCLLIVAAALVGASGCGSGGAGGDHPAAYPVTGTVTFNGKPVEGAHVTFVSEDGKQTAYGTTDAEGHFTLTTFEQGDGAVAGKHSVTISKFASSGGDDSGGETPVAPPANPKPVPPPTFLLPKKYSSVKQSGLAATVKTDSENHFEFQLKG